MKMLDKVAHVSVSHLFTITMLNILYVTLFSQCQCFFLLQAYIHYNYSQYFNIILEIYFLVKLQLNPDFLLPRVGKTFVPVKWLYFVFAA